MASIDKIYGTKEQYDEFHQWCEDNYPKALEYFYGWDWTNDKVHPITNFPIEIDGYLLIVCDIPWVVDRIKDQHGLINPLEAAAPEMKAALEAVAGNKDKMVQWLIDNNAHSGIAGMNTTALQRLVADTALALVEDKGSPTR